MTASPTPAADCPDDAQLAAYLEGSLAAADAQALETHLAECGRCAAVLVESGRTLRHLRGPVAKSVIGWRRVVKLLATAALLAVAVVIYRSLSNDDSHERVQMALAAFMKEYAGSRIVEPRVTSQASYAPFGLMRGPNPLPSGAAVTPEVRRAALAVEEAARGSSDPAALTAWGTTQLLLGQFDGAIAALTRAADTSGNQPGALNDLAAAYIARGSQHDDQEDIRRGLELTDQVLASGERNVEVLFNRALALERIGRRPEAIQAWREYIRVEGNPEWRREAQEHLDRLSAANTAGRGTGSVSR
jgi:tetratricopeptide (TPR) repeat protein